MARPKSLYPKYCVHKRSGRAYVTIDGRQLQLGEANSPASRAEYDKVVAAWLANGRKLANTPTARPEPPFDAPTVAMLLDAFWTHAESYYRAPVIGPDGVMRTNADGTPILGPAPSLEPYRVLVRMLRQLYGSMPTADFSCSELAALREIAIRPSTDPTTGIEKRGWSRKHTNQQVSKIKRIFRWGATQKVGSLGLYLVPENVPQRLDLLEGLRAGRSSARETHKVQPADTKRARAILPYCAGPVAAMIKLQLLTGMRSTEVCILRPCDIDRTSKPWIYRPSFHKTQHHDIPREIPLGPKSRKILLKFLKRPSDAFLFTPAEGLADLRKKARKRRKTNVQPSQVRRGVLASRRRPKLRARYTHASYYRAIQYACIRAFQMPEELKFSTIDAPDVRRDKSKRRTVWLRENAWHPHQLRHRNATELRKRGGLAVAKEVLGHTTEKMAEHYARPDKTKALRVMELVG